MNERFVVTPNDSRYVPFTQQDYCCVPTSLQMIMYRHGIPLLPAEELGYHLGLVVPPEAQGLFYDVRTATEPPAPAGYGTQFYNPEFEPNKIFRALGIPLGFELIFADTLRDTEDLLERLREIERTDTDALFCFNHGVVRGEYKPNSGHVAVFDRIVDGKVRLVDASWLQPKWRLIAPEVLLEGMQRHGNANSGGIWHFTYQPNSTI